MAAAVSGIPTSIPPRYPGARWAASPNHTKGRAGHQVKAACLHVTAGKIGAEYENAVTWFQNDSSDVSAHLVIGPQGQVTQCVEFGDMAWANGISYFVDPAQLPKGWSWQGAGWYSPRAKRVTPTWQLIQPPVNPNVQTVSIELAGQSKTPHPAAQIAAVVTALRWLGVQFPQLLPYVPGRTLIGHFNIDPLGRPDCPGPHVDFQAIAAAANGSEYAPGAYRYPALAVYERADLTGKVAKYLPADSVIAIDATTGPGYAETAGHVADGSGFVDLRRMVKA